jgi:hypothetical protein
MDEMDSRISRCESMLVDACREAGFWISGDGRINESAACELLGYSQTYLKQLRAEGKSPPHFRIPARGGQVSYRLGDIAGWVEERREEF